MRFVHQRKQPLTAAAKTLADRGQKVYGGCEFALNLGIRHAKTFEPVKTGDQITDYRNVRLKGYLSTFQDTTAADREGDYVMRGAFKDTIQDFMQNPVLLCNHQNTVQSIAGKFTVVREDQKGLYVEAKITDSPAEWARDIRWKIANDELKTLSMGGVFYYAPDQKGIQKVSLFEGSLTPIPSNPDAAFGVRALKDGEMTKAVRELGSSRHGVKLMDKPQKPRVNQITTGQDLWDRRYNARSISQHADQMSDWAQDQGTDAALQEAVGAHQNAMDHCTAAAEMCKQEGHTASAAELERMARRHGEEMTHLGTQADNGAAGDPDHDGDAGTK